jgi:hypothetical protein
VYNRYVAVHEQVLAAALALADRRDWTFRIADVIAALPALNPGTVRTHVASRCCVNAPAHHQSRHRYFRAVGRGLYRIEPAARQRRRRRLSGWQDRILGALASGVDATLIAESLEWTPTERLERMRRAAGSLQDART